MLHLLLACTTTPGDSVALLDTGAADTADSAGDSVDTVDVDTALDIHGNWATDRIPAPEFTATNRDESARSRPDLLGHPTAIWFYPAAGTSG